MRLFFGFILFLDNVTELSAVTIGDNVKVQIDFGEDLPSTMKLWINTCHIEVNNVNNLYFINDGTVMPGLATMVQLLETMSNRIAEFMWQVFTTGNDTRVTISCHVKIIKDAQEPITTEMPVESTTTGSLPLTTTSTTTTTIPTTTTVTTTTTTTTMAMLFLSTYESRNELETLRLLI